MLSRAHPYTVPSFRNRCEPQEIERCPDAGKAPDLPQKREFRWLARPRKRHYTFARRRLDHVTTKAVRPGPPPA